MDAKEFFDKIQPISETKSDLLVSLFYIAKHEYYHGKPTLSDVEFNKVETRLIDIGLINITQVVGSPVPATSKFIKRQHPRQMLSLNKMKNINDLVEWIGSTGNDHILTFKFDGLAIRLTYSHGVLVEAVTRGDGLEGEDIIENIKLIPTIPHEIGRFSLIDRFYVYGEVYILQPVFEGIFEPNGYKSPRNAAAGIVRKLDETRRMCEYLTFSPYDSSGIAGMSTYYGRMMLMKTLGFESLYMLNVNVSNIKQDVEIMENSRKNLNFNIDGLVIRVDHDHRHHELGNTNHHPRGSMAFKFESVSNTTILVDVVWQTGATGEITPIAIIKPTTIDGVTIERVNLHNHTYINKLNLEIGCEVEVIRANDVIPQIVRRI